MQLTLHLVEFSHKLSTKFFTYTAGVVIPRWCMRSFFETGGAINYTFAESKSPLMEQGRPKTQFKQQLEFKSFQSSTKQISIQSFSNYGRVANGDCYDI